MECPNFCSSALKLPLFFQAHQCLSTVFRRGALRGWHEPTSQNDMTVILAPLPQNCVVRHAQTQLSGSLKVPGHPRRKVANYQHLVPPRPPPFAAATAAAATASPVLWEGVARTSGHHEEVTRTGGVNMELLVSSKECSLYNSRRGERGEIHIPHSLWNKYVVVSACGGTRARRARLIDHILDSKFWRQDFRY